MSRWISSDRAVDSDHRFGRVSARHMTVMGRIGFIWGVGGVLLLLVDALLRLTPLAARAFSHSLTAVHWFFLVGWLAFIVLLEGYRGFHLSFSPRVVARALYLLETPRWVDVLAAPIFCISLYRTTRRRLIASWGMTAGIVSLILMVRTLPQPWRGLVDLGVVAALSLGLASTIIWLRRAQRGEEMPFAPELGEPTEDAERRGRGLSQAPTS